MRKNEQDIDELLAEVKSELNIISLEEGPIGDAFAAIPNAVGKAKEGIGNIANAAGTALGTNASHIQNGPVFKRTKPDETGVNRTEYMVLPDIDDSGKRPGHDRVVAGFKADGWTEVPRGEAERNGIKPSAIVVGNGQGQGVRAALGKALGDAETKIKAIRGELNGHNFITPEELASYGDQIRSLFGNVSAIAKKDENNTLAKVEAQVDTAAATPAPPVEETPKPTAQPTAQPATEVPPAEGTPSVTGGPTVSAMANPIPGIMPAGSSRDVAQKAANTVTGNNEVPAVSTEAAPVPESPKPTEPTPVAPEAAPTAPPSSFGRRMADLKKKKAAAVPITTQEETYSDPSDSLFD